MLRGVRHIRFRAENKEEHRSHDRLARRSGAGDASGRALVVRDLQFGSISRNARTKVGFSGPRRRGSVIASVALARHSDWTHFGPHPCKNTALGSDLNLERPFAGVFRNGPNSHNSQRHALCPMHRTENMDMFHFVFLRTMSFSGFLRCRPMLDRLRPTVGLASANCGLASVNFGLVSAGSDQTRPDHIKSCKVKHHAVVVLALVLLLVHRPRTYLRVLVAPLIQLVCQEGAF